MKKIYIALSLLLATYAQAQVGFGTPTPDLSAEVEIKATDKGVLIPRIALTSTIQKLNTNVNNADALLVFNNGTDLPQGFYYWKANFDTQNQNDGTGSWIAVGSETSALPKFFYMPSVVLPTTEEMVTAMANPYITHDAGVFTVDLYEIFKAQFTTPVKGSVDNTGLSGFVLAAAAYEYFVTYADASVFITNEINISANGVLTYKVNPNAIIRNGSFMNIVLKVKN